MNRVLIITYYWPPSGGAGVQRWLKFAKYLPQSGWEPIILTVDPDYAAYPSIDNTLEKDVTEGLKVYRTKATDWFRIYRKDKSKIPSAGFALNFDNTWKGKLTRFIRGNLFIPDPRRGWNKFAYKEACRIITNYNISHLITTSPPHSTQLIGLQLKKKFPEIAWISDMRDAWTDIYYYKMFYPTRIAAAIDAGYEKRVLGTADRIITVGNNLLTTFSSKKPGTAEKITMIPNGFDDEDFLSVKMTLPERFTITYIGTISEAYPTDALIEALAELERKGHDFLLRFVGTIPGELILKIRGSLQVGKTEFIPYTEHNEAIKLMASSSLLLLIIPVTKRSNAITPGKVFEYIATGKPVLYIGPADGDAAFHLEKCGQKGMFDGSDPAEIGEFIMKTMKMEVPEQFSCRMDYSRKWLTESLCNVLESSGEQQSK
jgi:glycosyltransferase involved in cell wall biosynthesis